MAITTISYVLEDVPTNANWPERTEGNLERIDLMIKHCDYALTILNLFDELHHSKNYISFSTYHISIKNDWNPYSAQYEFDPFYAEGLKDGGTGDFDITYVKATPAVEKRNKNRFVWHLANLVTFYNVYYRSDLHIYRRFKKSNADKYKAILDKIKIVVDKIALRIKKSGYNNDYDASPWLYNDFDEVFNRYPEVSGVYETEVYAFKPVLQQDQFQNAQSYYNSYGSSDLLNIVINTIEEYKILLKSLRSLFEEPDYGVSRIYTVDNYDQGPFRTFSVALFNNKQDFVKAFDMQPKSNPSDNEVDGARNKASVNAQLDLSFALARRAITAAVNLDENQAFAIEFVKNPFIGKEGFNGNVWTPNGAGKSILSSDSLSDSEKCNALAKATIREGLNGNTPISPGKLVTIPTGTDDTISDSSSGTGLLDSAGGGTAGGTSGNPNAGVGTNFTNLTPPKSASIDKKAIKEQAEKDLAAQQAAFGSTGIAGTIVDGVELEERDVIVTVPECLLYEVFSDGTSASCKPPKAGDDGKINIPEFGIDSSLKIIPPYGLFLKEKIFGPNQGEGNEIDFVYELDGFTNEDYLAGGYLLPETVITPAEEEEVNPRQVGGTVINSLTSEPIAGIDVSFGLGNRKVTTTTNNSGEFIIIIPEPKFNIGKNLDKLTSTIKAAQDSTLNPQKIFEQSQLFVNNTLASAGSLGPEILTQLANNAQPQGEQTSQFSSNIITGNISDITQIPPGLIGSSTVIDGLNAGGGIINDGLQKYNEAGGTIGLYGQGIAELNHISAKASNQIQKGLNYLTDPLNSQTFQDIQEFKDKLRKLQGKLPGNKIVIKGTGKRYITIDPPPQTTAGPPAAPVEVVDEQVKYRTTRISPFDADDKVIPDLGIIKATPRTVGIRKSLREVKYKNQFGNGAKILDIRRKIRDFELNLQIKRFNLTKQLRNEIIKNILVQVAVPLGITYLDPIIQQQKANINDVLNQNEVLCPSQKSLKKLIKTTNVLNKSLTAVYTGINVATQAANGGKKLIQVIQTSIEIYQFTPVIFGPIPTPDTVTKITSDKITTTKNDLEKGKMIVDNILLWTADISTYLSKAIDILKICQEVLERCLVNSQSELNGDKDVIIDPIEADLEEINEFVNSQMQPPIDPVLTLNGFSFDIENEVINNPAQQTNQLNIPRKRAVAKNADGIVVLKSEYSYTADPQILIEELKFYIRVNDLKAN